MEISDIINIILSILSFALAAISVVTVILTLKQNNKMVESSTRPYIVIYSKITNFQNQLYYLIIKNMGQTGAEIVDFKCDTDLSKFSYINGITPFEYIKGTFLAPGQSMKTNIDMRKLSENDIDNISFEITYSSEVKMYKEQYKINYKADRNIVQGRASTKGQELKAISYTLQDMVEKDL